MIKLKNTSIEYYPVVGHELRNYDINLNSSLKNKPSPYVIKRKK